ncbi:putative nefa-interacting nuclear protein nip30 [Phaeomoniella chlamydospora]|uniref:Putative nefa-interacting nuclear protein nip30 n=1 Tax=Phaeomoniella chlamydospora TaxID=158046 RepID=A0A0G2FPT2_PHACM|nr:putative nefa-interacting nuclear protein nip30 [Phaeomoniella chlamydospora]
MSSGFVSEGGAEESAPRDNAWLKVQRDLEAKRAQKIEQGKQEGGKSLYEVLQQNKAAKQEAFEESTRLKNQFRTLDEDEVEFLDSVLESTRAQEAAVRKETREQLEAFRKQQEAAEKAALEVEDASIREQQITLKASQEQWSARKRKRDTDKGVNGLLKLRKMSSSNSENTEAAVASSTTGKQSSTAKAPVVTSSVSKGTPAVEVDTVEPTKPSAVALGLGDYDSDDDEISG